MGRHTWHPTRTSYRYAFPFLWTRHSGRKYFHRLNSDVTIKDILCFRPDWYGITSCTWHSQFGCIRRYFVWYYMILSIMCTISQMLPVYFNFRVYSGVSSTFRTASTESIAVLAAELLRIVGVWALLRGYEYVMRVLGAWARQNPESKQHLECKYLKYSSYTIKST